METLPQQIVKNAWRHGVYTWFPDEVEETNNTTTVPDEETNNTTTVPDEETNNTTTMPDEEDPNNTTPTDD